MAAALFDEIDREITPRHRSIDARGQSPGAKTPGEKLSELALSAQRSFPILLTLAAHSCQNSYDEVSRDGHQAPHANARIWLWWNALGLSVGN